jgi:hypothetical protein
MEAEKMPRCVPDDDNPRGAKARGLIFALRVGKRRSMSQWPTTKEIEELNQENQDDYSFKEERAALVKLLNHVVV